MRPKQGFTLIEVLAAVAVLGLALAVIMQLFSADLRGISASSEYLSASVAAEAKLREVADRPDLGERQWSETTPEGYLVEMAVRPVLEERTASLPVVLRDVTVTLRYEAGPKQRSITLRTLRAGGRTL